jgi:2-methylcitrate dehydratase PrpD
LRRAQTRLPEVFANRVQKADYSEKSHQPQGNSAVHPFPPAAKSTGGITMLTRRLAEFVVSTRTQDIPAQVLAGARYALTDTLGCALAGTLEPAAELAAQWAKETSASGPATVWGRNQSTSPAEAAFANGIAGHALDFDDSLPSLRGHPSTTMGPAALAVGEASESSGVELLAAFALGLEVAGKLGRAIGAAHYVRGWHTTATIGTFSATTAAARLWGLNADQLQSAWGLAASQVAGLVRNFGTMTKPFHAGHAARSGVLAAWMAHHGFTADVNIFDGDNNFFATYGGNDGTPLAATIEQLGKSWEMLEPGIYVKRWPSCYCNARPVGGILKLIAEHGIRADEVEAVEVGFLPGSDTALVSDNPQTGLEGKFSIEYNAAATLLDGKLTLETFTDPMVQRPAVRKLMTKVKRYRIEASGTYSGVVGYTDVAIATKRGRFDLRVEHAPGSPEWPMTDADRDEKFLDCAGRVLGAPGAQRLLEQLQRFETIPNIKSLIKATVPQAGAAPHAARDIARASK